MKDKKLSPSLFFSMTWEFINLYLPTQHSGSKNTIQAYTDALTMFRRYVTDIKKYSILTFTFKECTYDFLLDYRNYMVTKEYASSSVNHRLSVIKAYVHYAALRNVELQQFYFNIVETPLVDVPHIIPPIIEDDEAIKDLLSAPGPSKKGIRDSMILTILFDTAIRCDELVRLKCSDVVLNPDNPYLLIHGKGDKERRVPLSNKTVNLIEQYKSIYHNSCVRENPFFYTIIKDEMSAMTERNVQRILKKYEAVLKEKYPDLPKLHPHILRRTRATKWHRSGVPMEVIAEILGHSSVDTTRASYAFSSPKSLKSHIDKTQKEDCKKEEKLWVGKEKELSQLCGLR